MVPFTCKIGYPHQSTRMRINENFNPDSLDFVLYLDGDVRVSVQVETRRKHVLWGKLLCVLLRVSPTVKIAAERDMVGFGEGIISTRYTILVSAL